MVDSLGTAGIEREEIGDLRVLGDRGDDVVPAPIEVGRFQKLAVDHAAGHRAEGHAALDLGLVAVEELLRSAPTDVGELVTGTKGLEILEETVGARTGIEMVGGRQHLLQRRDAAGVVDLRVEIVVQGIGALGVETPPPFPGQEILGAIQRRRRTCLRPGGGTRPSWRRAPPRYRAPSAHSRACRQSPCSRRHCRASPCCRT